MRINSEMIVNDFSEFVESLEKISEQHLISFAFFLDDINILSFTDEFTQYSDDLFIFQSPGNSITIAGLNSAVEITNKNTKDLSSVIVSYSELKEKHISNWSKTGISSLPILCASLKFDPSHSSQQWEDFNAIRINVPELLFVNQSSKTIGCYNVTVTNKSDLKQIRKLFSEKLKAFIEIFSDEVKIDEGKIFTAELTPDDKSDYWKSITEQALQVLQTGIVEKLVLSRPYKFFVNGSLKWTELLKRLNHRFSDCYLFFIKKNSSVFFGSSPEMFLKVSGNTVEVESVAGSAPRGNQFESDHAFEKILTTSDKNHREHQYVSEFITDVLKKYSNSIRIIEEKQVKKLDNIQHLTTRISAELSNDNLFELINSLFPTPAVCGVPKNSAMSFIRKLETHDRGLYSGLVGWIDFNGGCELAVAIRSALLKDNCVIAFAGAGLVKNSNPDEEFEETRLKLDPILSLFNQKFVSRNES